MINPKEKMLDQMKSQAVPFSAADETDIFAVAMAFGEEIQKHGDPAMAIYALKQQNEELRAKYEKLQKLNLAQHEMYEKDNNTLHDEIAALKAQSTEPVAWMLNWNVWFDPLEKRPDGTTPLYTTPPTAEALVEDFRKRAVEVVMDNWLHLSRTTQVDMKVAIESLPLIEEKK